MVNPLGSIVTPSAQSLKATEAVQSAKADILVAGSVAIDLGCDFIGGTPTETSPKLHTSNPSTISQTIGGVGHNVALAASRASSKTKVKLCSLIGDDL